MRYKAQLLLQHKTIDMDDGLTSGHGRSSNLPMWEGHAVVLEYTRSQLCQEIYESFESILVPP